MHPGYVPGLCVQRPFQNDTDSCTPSIQVYLETCSETQIKEVAHVAKVCQVCFFVICFDEQ